MRDPGNVMSIFNSALHDKSKWLANNRVMKQQVYKKKPSSQLMKTGWSTTVIVGDGDHEIEGQSDNNDYQMLEVKKSLETSSMVRVDMSLAS